MRRKVVIAGNYRQFMDWCSAHGVFPPMAIYANSKEKLMGLELKEEDIVKTGEWWLSEVDEAFLRTRIR